MQQPTRLISTPFAQEGEKTEIQNVTGEFDNSATYRLGFPPLTMQSIRSGGKPPKGTDFNGVLFDITENISFLCKGGRYQYNAGLSTLIGGYPEGSNLLLDDNVTEVVSTVAGNQNNPNTNMTGWVLKPNRTTAEYVLDASGETQQQVNYNGGSKWYSRVGGYKLNERVVLTNGDIVKSTIDGNVNNPNVDMTGWVLDSSDSAITTWSGRTQEFENKRMSRTRLGQRILHENLTTSIDGVVKYYPQGGCKVGNSLFLKIGNNIGTVGASTEQFIIVEYDFDTGVKLSETAPMETLGHHELSGFIKDGKTYLVTSYQPASDILNRSGVGISLIEWKGSATNLSNVQQFELLDTSQYIGYPVVDDSGAYVYISNSKYGASSGSGELRRAPIINIQVHKLSDILIGKFTKLYSFNIEIPAGDGLQGSSSLNGLSATSNHLYVVFGGAYSVTQITKYTLDGILIETIQTALGRSARPQSEVITENLFLYNTEPEGAFISDGKIYLITAEDWYGAGEFVKFNNKFYMARYGMTGKSPASHADHWVEVSFIPTVWANYSPSTTYLGRNTSIGSFKRTIVEISLKTASNYDLMMTDSVGEIPNMTNNLAGRVHIYGCLQTSPELTLGMYDYQRQTFQKNMTLDGSGLKLFDTQFTTTLNDKSASVRSFQSGGSSLLRLMANDASQSDALLLYGKYHGSADNTVEHPYLARWESGGSETAVFYRDGRLYNYSKNSSIGCKYFVNGIETLAVINTGGVSFWDTGTAQVWFGKTAGGVHGVSTLGINHDLKNIYPASTNTTALGTNSLKWKQVAARDLILQPSVVVNPVDNGELVVEATSNTTVTIKLKGTDGVVRSVALTLA